MTTYSKIIAEFRKGCADTRHDELPAHYCKSCLALTAALMRTHLGMDERAARRALIGPHAQSLSEAQKLIAELEARLARAEAGGEAAHVDPEPNSAPGTAKCTSCGKDATHSCAVDCGMSLCGAPLCDRCTHVDQAHGWAHEVKL